MKFQFLFDVRGAERFFVRFGDDGGLVVLVGLPENDADLVIGEILVLEDFDVFVGVAFGPAFLVTLFDSGAVRVGDAIAFIAERFRLFLKLLAGINQHHAPAMAGGFVVPQ